MTDLQIGQRCSNSRYILFRESEDGRCTILPGEWKSERAAKAAAESMLTPRLPAPTLPAPPESQSPAAGPG